MTVLFIVGILVGFATGSRFRAIAVVPVMAFMMAIIFGAARGEMVWWLAATAAVSVQLGYLCGGILRFAVHAKRLRESNAKPTR